MTPFKPDIQTFYSAWNDCLSAAMNEAGNTHNANQVYSLIQTGDALFWLGEKSACVTDFFLTPNHKAVNGWLVGGDLKEILGPMLSSVEQWAKANGYKYLLMSGRKEWTCAITRKGFEPTHIIFEKAL